jgi:hypothetical protein
MRRMEGQAVTGKDDEMKYYGYKMKYAYEAMS